MSKVLDIIDEINPSTRTKGKRIFSLGFVHPDSIEIDLNSTLGFTVRSENNVRLKYHVSFNLLHWHSDGPVCSCPQHLVEQACKHVVACLYKLAFIEKNNPENIVGGPSKPIYVDEKRGNVQISKTHYLDYQEITKGMGIQQHAEMDLLIRKEEPKIVSHEPHKNTVTFEIGKESVKFDIYPKYIAAFCTCKHTKPTFCVHTRAILISYYRKFSNPFYIRTFRDVSAEKMALLKSVGYEEQNEEVNELFEFYFEYDRLSIKPKQNIVFELENSTFAKKLSTLKINAKPDFTSILTEKPDGHILLFRLNSKEKTFNIDLHPITGQPQNPTKIKAKINFKSKFDLLKIAPQESDLLFDWSRFGKIECLRNRGLLSTWYRNEEHELAYEMSEQKWTIVDQHLLDSTKNSWGWLANHDKSYLLVSEGGKINPSDLIKLTFSPKTVNVHIKLEKQSHYLTVKAQLLVDGEYENLEEYLTIRHLIFIKNSDAFLIDDFKHKALLDIFGINYEIKIVNSKIDEFLKNFIFPIRNQFSIDIPEDLIPETHKSTTVQKAVRLKELEPNFLIIEPFMIYDNNQIGIYDDDSYILIDGKTTLVDRDFELEKDLESFIKKLHPDFEEQTENSYFYLPIQKVIQNHWFLQFYKDLDENGVTVFGQKELKKLRFNSNRPKINISGSSGIDWFDLQIELSYGDEIVPLKLLKSAIVNKQDFITLSDGSLGLLPEEWIKKFSTILKISNIEKEKVKVSKLHFGLLDAAEEFLKDEKIREELAEKKRNLLEIDNTQDVALPKNIKATLRPYQLAGFQWFNKLYKMGWGGCLADDMGLGKTLQSLCFIRHVHNQKPQSKSLIVCPTSLIYNWASEAQKFTPDLRVHTYHGLLREFPESENFDLLITSYGTFRNDLEKLNNLNFEICILDESQAIKNPKAHITKAVTEINTANRYILSGTPLQNNTFDLFSQFNFINPGLLGNQEFFKEEFSTPIDKYADSDKSQQLRKMIYPFMLRRTKEQVAKDLPDKTESIIYCEMDKYQRKVYDSIKTDYRDRIMGKIAEDGVQKSAFLILEGLNRLRMVCDCPSLIKDGDTRHFKSESVKLNELVREMDENAGQHKVLIFSQFLGMLDLLRVQLEAKGIKHLYLDGGTAAKDRQGLVDSFQNDADIKVFLISLKAGGVGLNLTAADYVYIVDPWWNPAVEDQAIDRTHRIGQKNKIFAYKLICKDTIEEKIHQLQQKKKKLAKEIVSEEASFIKKLTKDDVAWLLE